MIVFLMNRMKELEEFDEEEFEESDEYVNEINRDDTMKNTLEQIDMLQDFLEDIPNQL